jgi:tetratricopeptide (TPR) repeat protein
VTGRQWGPPQEVRAIVEDEWAAEAQRAYEAGDIDRSRELAIRGLEKQPEDTGLLDLAGRSSLELGLGDAVEHFRRLVAVAPDDTAALLNLAHAVYAGGDAEEAAQLLTRVADLDPANLVALRHLVDMHRRAGRHDAALESARRVAEHDPDDVLAALDVAELSLDSGAYDDARAAFDRVRGIDADEEHRPFAYHGMIEVEIRREQWRPALDVAIEATQEDRNPLTTALLAYIANQLFGGSGDRPAPTAEEIDDALVSERDAHRRLHVEARALA